MTPASAGVPWKATEYRLMMRPRKWSGVHVCSVQGTLLRVRTGACRHVEQTRDAEEKQHGDRCEYGRPRIPCANETHQRRSTGETDDHQKIEHGGCASERRRAYELAEQRIASGLDDDQCQTIEDSNDEQR